MGQPLVGDEEEGDGGAGRQEEDEGDDDLLGQRGAGVVAVLRLSSGLEKNKGLFINDVTFFLMSSFCLNSICFTLYFRSFSDNHISKLISSLNSFFIVFF